MNTSGLEDRLTSIVDDVCHRVRAPGLSVAVSAGGERAAICRGTIAAGSGLPMTSAARFQLGCIAKLLTCVVAAQLAHEGRMDFDHPIYEYLPDLAPAADGRDIRIRHLGTHTSGYRGLSPAIPEYGYYYSWPKFADFFRGTEQVFRPGSVFNYEHTESVILGEVIRRVSGSPCGAMVRDLLLEPLRLAAGTVAGDEVESGMRVADHSFDRASGQYVPVKSVPYCDFWLSSLSSMTISPVDLVTLGEVLSGLRRVPGICGEAVDDVVRQAVELPRSSGGPEREASPRTFGFGCAQYAGGVLGHNGSARGQTCALRFSPRHGVVVVAALNCWEPYARDSLLDAVFQALLPGDAAESETTRGQAEFRLEELTGTYKGCVQGLEIVVTRQEDRLLCTIGGLTGAGARKLNLEMTFDEAGELRAKCPLRHLSVGFFREESSGAPAMLVGLNAFKRV